MQTTNEFGLKFTNIPLMNLRAEFIDFHGEVEAVLRAESEYRISQSGPWKRDRVDIDAWFNRMARQTIMGLECYVSASVRMTVFRANLMTEEIDRKLKKPFSMGRNTHDVHFHHLPCLIGEYYSLKFFDETLWRKNKALYAEVRNKIFHGYQATDVTPQAMADFSRHLNSVYEWIHLWCSWDIENSDYVHPAPKPEYLEEMKRRNKIG